jgi:hypothetical protein
MTYYPTYEEWQSLIIFGVGALFQLFHYDQYRDPTWFKKLKPMFRDVTPSWRTTGWAIIYYPFLWPYIWFAMNTASAAGIFLLFKQYDTNSDYWVTSLSMWICLTIIQKCTVQAFSVVTNRIGTASNNPSIWTYPMYWVTIILSMIAFGLSLVLAVMAGLVWQDDDEKPGEAVAVSLFSLIGLWQLYLFFAHCTFLMKYVKSRDGVTAGGVRSRINNRVTRGQQTFSEKRSVRLSSTKDSDQEEDSIFDDETNDA